MLDFTPLSEDEAKASKITAFEGKFDFKIHEIEEKTSSSGNKMLAIVLLVTKDDMGNTSKVWDWIMLEGKMAWRLRELCCCLGLEDKYANKTISIEDFQDAEGVVVTKISHTKQDKEEGREPSTRVREYVDRHEAAAGESPEPAKEDDSDDQIPV